MAKLIYSAIASLDGYELHLLLAPIIVGGGKRALPGSVHAQLQLVGERRFHSGVVHLHYRMST